MSRNRVISQTQALFAGPSPATGAHASGSVKQILRTQSANYSFSIARQDVAQYGQLAAIDRVQTDPPQVNLDFSYLAVDAVNEERLGFVVDGTTSAISGILNKTEDDRNYFLLTVPEGNDAVGYTAGLGEVIGIGNGFLSNYTAEGAVGGFPTCSATVEGLNMRGYLSGTAVPIPAVNPVNGAAIAGVNFTLPSAVSGFVGQPTALRPGDITLAMNNNSALFAQVSGDVCIQSYNISVDLTRGEVQCLGSKYAKSREIQFPANVTISVDLLMGDLQTGSLANILCQEVGYDTIITLRQPSCAGDGDVAIKYTVKNAKLESENFSSSIGPAETVSLTWIASLGGPQDLVNGLFISGKVEADY